jgi:cytochrome c biogenesis protein CcmG/thiol:disulfide interchange protein DsbE
MERTLKLAAQAAATAGVVALLALLVWRVSHGGGGAAEELERGKTPLAPAFALERLDRPGTLALESLRGRAVVINFWASWCIPCKEEARYLESAWKRYRSRGLVVLGVDVQDFSGDARRFARRYGMTYPLVRDGRGETLEDYGATGVPETYFVNRQGRLVGERIQGPVNRRQEAARFEENVRLALAR